MNPTQLFWNGAIYLGIIGLVFLTAGLLTGLRIIKPKAKWRLHKKFGILTGITVGIHALVMLYFYLLT
jgi:hypothetical protein